MSFNEVTELRKQGRLDEAEKLARKNLEQDVENIWNRRSLAWVLETAIKKANEQKNLEQVLIRMEQIAELALPEEEDIFWNTLGWQIYFALKTGESLPKDKQDGLCRQMFRLIRMMRWAKKTDGYRMLVKGFYCFRNIWPEFVAFCDWWGFEHLSPADYEMQIIRNEKVISWAERLYIAYAKALLIKPDQEQISNFLPQITTLHEQHPEMMYPGYFICKLMMANESNPNDVLAILLPFVRKKRKDFWTWQLLAELFVQDKDKQLACLLMAFYATRQLAFLGRVMEQLTEVLIHKEEYGAARFVIEKYGAEKNKNQQSISTSMKGWMHTEWFATNKPIPPCQVMNYKELAMQILYSDMPKQALIVTHVNVPKKMFSYIFGIRKKGYAKWDNIQNVQVGSMMQAQWTEPQNEGGPHKLFTLRRITETKNYDFCRRIKGRLKINEIKKCAFLKAHQADVFIPKHLLPPDCCEGEHEVTAVFDFNTKKNDWSWRAIAFHQ